MDKTTKCAKCGAVIIASEGFFNYPSGAQCAKCGFRRSVDKEERDTWPKMKRFHTNTDFDIFKIMGSEVTRLQDRSGNSKRFKNRKAAEELCQKHGCMYAEVKMTFYK